MSDLGYSPLRGMAAPDKTNVAGSMQLGYTEHEFLDASSGDATAATVVNCRAIVADEGGIVKIEYIKANGDHQVEVLILVSGFPRVVRGVQKLFRYYTGTTAGTAKSYNDSGFLITNAIKLLR